MCFGTVESLLLTFRFGRVPTLAGKPWPMHQTNQFVVCVKYSKRRIFGILEIFPTNIENQLNKDVNNIASKASKPLLTTKIKRAETGSTTGKIILGLSDSTRSARRSKNPLNPCNPYCMIHCKPNDGFVDFLQLRVAFWRPLMSRNIF